ncbi:hypothetical protein ACT691_11445 [Vibrio metschnikovii]
MAYHSEQLTLQPAKEAQGFLRRVLTKGQVFLLRKPMRPLLSPWLGKLHLHIIRDRERSRQIVLLNEERLNSETFSNWTQLYLFIVGLAKMSLVVILPLAYFLIFIGLIFGSGGWSARSETFYGLTLYITFPFYLFMAILNW